MWWNASLNDGLQEIGQPGRRDRLDQNCDFRGSKPSSPQQRLAFVACEVVTGDLDQSLETDQTIAFLEDHV